MQHTPASPRLNRRDAGRTSACTSAVRLRPCALRPLRPSHFAAFVSIGPVSLFGASSLVLLSDPVREKRHRGMRTREAAHTWRAHTGVARTNGKETHPELGVFLLGRFHITSLLYCGSSIGQLLVTLQSPRVRLPPYLLLWCIFHGCTCHGCILHGDTPPRGLGCALRARRSAKIMGLVHRLCPQPRPTRNFRVGANPLLQNPNRHDFCRPFHLHFYMTLAATSITQKPKMNEAFRPFLGWAKLLGQPKTFPVFKKKKVLDLSRCSSARGASSRDCRPRKYVARDHCLPCERRFKDVAQQKSRLDQVETFELPALYARESGSFFGAKPSKLSTFLGCAFFTFVASSRDS